MNINMDTIIKDSDAHLRDKSAPVSLPLSEADKNTLMELLTYVRESTDPELANAKIVSPSVQNSYLKTGEGCLSVLDDHPGYVIRSARIKVKGYDMLQDRVLEHFR